MASVATPSTSPVPKNCISRSRTTRSKAKAAAASWAAVCQTAWRLPAAGPASPILKPRTTRATACLSASASPGVSVPIKRRSNNMTLTSKMIKDAAITRGADICGIASVERFAGGPPETHPNSLFPEAKSVIVYASRILKGSYKKKNAGKMSASDRIDHVVTNRFLALPIFALVMFLVYFVSVSTVGTWATDWANDGVFGDGWHLLGIGSSAYAEATDAYVEPGAVVKAFAAAAEEAGLDPAQATDLTATAYLYDDNGVVTDEIPVTYTSYQTAAAIPEPEAAEYGVWVPGVPALLGSWLEQINTADWLRGLLLDGIVAGVGAVLGFVPQMLVLFLFLAFLEACGYMARVAFVMDRIFRKFGLSGKSFIPMLIGTGCGVPGIMASRTIENERDRRMTIMTTTFIPCGAKLPIIALIAGAMFGGAAWVAPSAYFLGILAIVVSGVMLKKTRMFAGDPAPFVMELPAYHWPTVSNVLRSMWERGWSFIKKAGTIILLATILVWFTSNFGWADGAFGMVEESTSILAVIGGAICVIFAPLGWGHWQGAVASITGLIAKENVVGTFGVLFGGFDEVAENGWQIWNNMAAVFTPLSAYSFLVFNLLCAPCFAAMGAIKREMNSAKWTLFAIGYQCVFAYAIALVVYQLGMLFTGQGNVIGSVAAFAIVAFILWMLFRPYQEPGRLTTKIKVSV
ncbi:MAG: ferrous iron transport protein B [Clostridia bacterium]|nr:ferrous iron transport protein B [Clostridia bacterium]